MTMQSFVKIGEASKILGVTPETLRRWERQGELCPDIKIRGTRYYSHESLNQFKQGVQHGKYRDSYEK
jgi:DNA-binding transcriptional MerR regulator